jgi:hypothetical protein
VPKRRLDGPPPAIDFQSTVPVDYSLYCLAKGWSYSTGQRRRAAGLPTTKLPGIPRQVVPAAASAFLRGELPQHAIPQRGRPRTRREYPQNSASRDALTLSSAPADGTTGLPPVARNPLRNEEIFNE